MNKGENTNPPFSKKVLTCKRILPIFVTSLLYIAGFIAEAQDGAQSGYSLNGTIQSSDLTGAILTVAKGEQTFFRKFDKLPDGSQIVGVHPDNIVIKRPDGTTYEMYVLHETKTVASVQPTQPIQSVQPIQPNQTGQPSTRVDPYAPGSIRSAPSERPLSSYERRHGRRKSDSGNE